MKKVFILAFIMAIAAIGAVIFAQQPEQSNFYVLNDVKIENKTIKITTTGPVKYNIFKVSNPPRLVIELFNTEIDVKEKEQVITNNIIKRMRAGQFQNDPIKIARVVLDLNKIVDFEATQDNNITTIILIDKTENGVKQATKNTVKAAAKTQSKGVSQNPAVSKKPAQAQPKKQKATAGVTTKLPRTPVTLEYQAADIRDVLQVMSLKSGVNIIYGEDVAGDVTISLKNVPFDEAFNTILALKSLTSIPVSGNVIRVITPDALKKDRQNEVTYTKIYPLNYAEAVTIQTQILSVLSAREIKGQVTVDGRTNALVVTATTEGLEVVEKVLTELDIKPQQVMIQTRVVDLTLTDLSELGVTWSVENITSKAGTGVTSPNQTLAVGPNVAVTQAGQTGGEIRASGASTSFPLPTSGGIFSFGYVTDKDMFNAKLGALVTSGKAKVLSNPRVTTINNKEAKILAGDKMPIKQTNIPTGGGIATETYTFLDTGVQLTVTPTISPEGWITLKVHPIVSVPLTSPGGGAPPTVRSRETDVTVMVKNNDTLVIGGLITENDIDDMSAVPLISDLPLLGSLFKYRTTQKIRSELIVFITPIILPD